MKISGLMILSEPERYCYPYLESIQSFLPVVDEMILVLNPYKNDGAREKIEALKNPKIRIIPGFFDLYNVGWVSYAVMRTTGYQAATGDVILMSDCDGILHEKDQEFLKKRLAEFHASTHQNAYWDKFRFYQATGYWDQHKHSGIYDKSKLKDDFDFYHPSGKGIPHFKNDKPAMNIGVWLYGYEHLWDTKEVITERSSNYGRMIDRQYAGKIEKTNEEYFEAYRQDLIKDFAKRKKFMKIEDQPAIIQDKLRNLNESHFGFNFFK